MKAKTPVLFLILWLVLGGIFALIYFQVAKHPSTAAVRNQIEGIMAGGGNSGIVLDRMPQVFESHRGVAAVFLAAQNGALLGSMYESRRMSSDHYKNLVKNFNRVLNGRLGAGMRLMRVQAPQEAFQVFIAFRAELGLADVWHGARHTNSKVRWVGGAYLLIGSLLFIFALVAFFSGNQSPISPAARAVRKVEKIARESSKTQPISGHQIIPESRDHNPESLLFHKELRQLMGLLYERYPYKSLAFHLRENHTWHPALQRNGNIFIRGEAVSQLPAAVGQLSNPASWSEPLLREEGADLLIPLRRKNMLIGAFHFRFGHNQRITVADAGHIVEIVAGFARSIFIQKTYEKAVLDEDTGAYTYPYYHFALKERLLSPGHFATLIMQLSPVERLTVHGLRAWSQDINARLAEWMEHQVSQGNQSATQQPHLFARLDHDLFAIIFDMNENGMAVEQATDFAREVKLSAKRLLGKELKLIGALVPRLPDVTSVDAYSRRVQYGLQQARERENFGHVVGAA